jgi:hypothetical protein
MKYLLFVFGLAALNPAFAQDDLPVQNTNDLVISAMNNAAMQNTLPENKRDNCYLRASSKECKSRGQIAPGGFVQLPAGWSISTPAKNGVAKLARRGSSDIVLAGVMPFADARQIVQQLSAQETPAFSVERVLPIRTVTGGILQSGAALKSADGKPASKYVFALPLANGTTALTALYTTEQQVGPQLEASIKGMIDIITQLKAGRTMGGASAAVANAAPPPRGPAGVPKSPLPPSAVVASSAQQLSGQIDMIAFYLRYQFQGFGVGSVVPTPVVLFKNGEALYDISVLKKSAADIAAHRQRYPDEWTKWRRVNGKLQLLEKKGWDALAFDTVMSSLPRGLKLAGIYRLTGGANFSSPGFTSNILAWDDLSFLPDGRFQGGGGANTTSSYDGPAVSTSTAIPARSAARFGRYAIDGYTLTLRYDDGRVEQRMITADPKELNVIYLDGDGYIRQKADQQK